MSTKLSSDSIKGIEAISAIKAYRSCTTQEALEILSADKSKTLDTYKKEVAETMHAIFQVASRSFFKAVDDAGLDLEDFISVVSESDSSERNNPDDEESGNSTIH